MAIEWNMNGQLQDVFTIQEMHVLMEQTPFLKPVPVPGTVIKYSIAIFVLICCETDDNWRWLLVTMHKINHKRIPYAGRSLIPIP